MEYQFNYMGYLVTVYFGLTGYAVKISKSGELDRVYYYIEYVAKGSKELLFGDASTKLLPVKYQVFYLNLSGNIIYSTIENRQFTINNNPPENLYDFFATLNLNSPQNEIIKFCLNGIMSRIPELGGDEMESGPKCFKADTLQFVNPIEFYVSIQNGSDIIVDVQNGGGGYRYSLDGVDFSNTTGQFLGVTSGIYQVYVKSLTDDFIERSKQVVV